MILKKENDYRFEGIFVPIFNKNTAGSRAFYPVNRRRVLGKGWHVDIGPGFDAKAQRSINGHPMQGLILLVLLTDSHEGGGGTAFVRGSHRSIIRNGFRENAFGEEKRHRIKI